MSRLVGILNVTPDSFSDGGRFFSPESARRAIEDFIRQGADIIDIGAESTRPNATPLTAEEEWQRLEPVLRGLYLHNITFSLDTRHAETARKALVYGVGWINDVSGFSDPAMVEAVRQSSCKLVVMHSLSVPADSSLVLPESVDAVQEVMAFGRARIAALVAAGIAKERIIFDPGIGFGKTAKQSHALVAGIGRFNALGVPLLVGHSRKSFLGDKSQRDEATLTLSRQLMRQGVAYLRVHDIAAHRQLQQEILYG